MNLDDLRAFEVLTQELHFGRASRKLGRSPSALSRQVAALEAELGHALFHRDRRSVGLTAAGQLFQAYARSQLKAYSELRAELEQEREAPRGELQVACTVTACHSLLPGLLAKSRVRYPELLPRLVTQDAARSLLQLQSGEVDLAVIPTDAESPAELVQVVLGRTELRLIAPLELAWVGLNPEAYPLAQALVPEAALPIVAQAGGLDRARLRTWQDRRGLVTRIVAEVQGNEGILSMVALGSGIALVPELVLAASPQRDKLKVLQDPAIPPGYTVSLCALPSSLRRPQVRVFVELARELGFG